jgi:hypothetical protein
MQILLATSTEQFHNREIELESLRDQLQALGASTDVLVLPFSMEDPHVLAQLASYRMLDVRHFADCMVSLSPPTHMLRHPNKVLTFSEDGPQMVDSWDRKYGAIETKPMQAIRNLIVHAEQVATEEAALGICFSHHVARRMQSVVNSVVIDATNLAFQLVGKKAKNPRLAGKVVA